MKKLLTAIAIAATALAVHAQNWPEKSVTLVVPFPPGGSTDQVARAIGPKLTDKFKQSFLVDNKAGATGTIGATFVKRAAPDGYTFLVTSLGPLVIVPTRPGLGVSLSEKARGWTREHAEFGTLS